MTNRMPDNISDGPQADDKQIIPVPDPDEMRDLVNTLEDITLSQQVRDVQDSIADLRKRIKEQAE